MSSIDSSNVEGRGSSPRTGGRTGPILSSRSSTKGSAWRDEGCLTVEMEAAALAAIARFRGVPLAQVVYCGDDLAGSSWDHRSWQSLSDVREDLFDISATAALALAAT
jgi:uridine phosphorylase